MLEDSGDSAYSYVEGETAMVAQSGMIRKKGSKYYIFDANSGRELLLKGYGSLKGQLELDARIDLTKPIFEQVCKPTRARRRGPAKSLAAAD